MKFPNLVEHYIFHKISNENTTLFSFVKLHYLDESIVDSDYDQDMKLPFKTHETNTYSMILLTLPESFGLVIKVPEIFLQKTPIFSYSPSYTSDPLESIFHPPILF